MINRLVAPCTRACPAGLDVPRYVSLIGKGRFDQALAVIRQRMPFPSICGRVCYHPCEEACRRGRLDEPIAINHLKRFAADQSEGVLKGDLLPPTGKRVAVVGSGPAGLTAAYHLARLGHGVTIFEALPEVGGMLRVGIPPYRLPREVLEREIRGVGGLGVEIRTEAPVESVNQLFKQGYHSIFLALGAHQGSKLRIEGEDSPGVMDCISFLRDKGLGREVRLGDRVAVIGGGNVAMDGARSALRLGARDVIIVYRRSRAEMPAHDFEVEAALGEGVKIEFLATPTRIVPKEGALEMECIRMRLGQEDASGRRRPEPIPGSEFTLERDAVIAAIGQLPEVPPELDLPLTSWGSLQVDPDTLSTDREGVYAGGDVVTGPASFVEAVAAGRKVATSIDRYLGGEGAVDETLALSEEEIDPGELDKVSEGHRVPMPSLPVSQRACDFSEVELGYSEEAALEEAKRCLRCDLWRIKVPKMWSDRTGRGGEN